MHAFRLFDLVTACGFKRVCAWVEAFASSQPSSRESMHVTGASYKRKPWANQQPDITKHVYVGIMQASQMAKFYTKRSDH